MTLSEIIYNIKNLVAGGIQSDDQNLSDEQLAFIVDYYRARLLKNDQEKGRVDKTLFVQNLGIVDLISADKNGCCEDSVCLLRTKQQIPSPLETYKGMNITFVGSLDGLPYQKTYHNVLPVVGAAKWTGNKPKWYYENGYIYLIKPTTAMIDIINVQGIFESPWQAEKFKTCDCLQNEQDCLDTYDFKYPMPQHHVDTIVKLFASTELRILASTPIDTLNNSVNQLGELLQKSTPNGRG